MNCLLIQLIIEFQLVNAQAHYHKKTLEVLEGLLPQLQVHMGKFNFIPRRLRVITNC